jgi:hypothetical protein
MVGSQIVEVTHYDLVSTRVLDFFLNCLRISTLIDEVRLGELGFLATSRMNLERVDVLASTSSSRASQNSASSETLVFWPAIVIEYFVLEGCVMVGEPL